jgi:nanoRNase/pAp phosphatase (c-di-AMP/oligoRNAs hydrolase)
VNSPKITEQPAAVPLTGDPNVVLTHATADFDDSLASAVGLLLWSAEAAT